MKALPEKRSVTTDVTSRKPWLNHRLDWNQLQAALEERESIVRQRIWIQRIWKICSKPVKFPARRRRSDRQIPKAA